MAKRKFKRPTEVGTLTAGAIASVLLDAGFSKPTAAIVALAVGVLPGIITGVVEAWRVRHVDPPPPTTFSP